jgi:hypothetical protein
VQAAIFEMPQAQASATIRRPGSAARNMDSIETSATIE